LFSKYSDKKKFSSKGFNDKADRLVLNRLKEIRTKESLDHLEEANQRFLTQL